jgi:hypothetical protein
VNVEVSLHPLTELEIVLILALHKLLDVDGLNDSETIPGFLKDLEVLDELNFGSGVEVHSVKRKLAREESISHLTKGNPRANLFHLCVIKGQEIIDPTKKLCATYKVSALHDS